MQTQPIEFCAQSAVQFGILKSPISISSPLHTDSLRSICKERQGRRQMLKGERRASVHMHMCFGCGLLHHSPGSLWGSSVLNLSTHRHWQQALASLVFSVASFPSLVPGYQSPNRGETN